MRAQPRGTQLVGRDAELESVRAFLAGEGSVRALMLSGDPGIGKTTLWETGLDLAREGGWRTLVARATEQEVRLSYVALSDLLEDVESPALAGVPPPQLRALEVALLRVDPGPDPPDALAVSAGFARSLRVLARQAPLLVAVDDVPWLDRSSLEVLSFAARRLSGSGVRFLLARRPGEPTSLEQAFGSSRLDVLRLGPLSLGATRAMLTERLGLSLPRRVLRRLFESTGGNPLFALELGRMLVDRGVPEIGAELPIPELVDDLFGDRIAALPPPAKRALLAVALSGGLSNRRLGGIVDPLGVEDAVSAGVLVVDGARVRAAHPLLAAAARRHSTAAERRELHLALATAFGDETRKAQHLARAAATPDSELAADVARAAANASSRGAAHDAVELCEQSLRLTPSDRPEYAERLLELARYLVVAGELPRARELLEQSLDTLPPGPLRGRAYLELGGCADTADEWQGLVEQALADSGEDAELRATALATKSIVLAVTRFTQIDEAERLADEALALAGSVGPEVERAAACAVGWVRVLRGRPLDDLVTRHASPPQGASLYENAIERVVGSRQAVRGEMAEGRALFQRLAALAEERGEARSGLIMHFGVLEFELRAGDASAAEGLMAEVNDWIAFENTPEEDARVRATLELLHGRFDEAEQLAEESLLAARTIGTTRVELEALRLLGTVALLQHRPDRAVECFRPIRDYAQREGIVEPGLWPIAPDFVESLVELGELDEAQALTELLERLSEEQQHPWGLASCKRCRGVIGLAAGYDEASAELLVAAANDYRAHELGFDEARSLLFLGRTQRRFKKWSAARAALQRATAVFTALGCTGWADQSRAELERVGARRPTAEGALTTTEERVARLAAGGLSNKEIAAELFVTVNTVEKHLSHAYAKLGVRSRRRLAQQLPAR